MITPEKAIASIEKRILLLDEVEDSDEFFTWKRNTMLTLLNFYPENDRRIREIENITAYYYVSMEYGDKRVDTLIAAIEEADVVLTHLISDIDEFGIPLMKALPNPNNVNVSVNQSNNQVTNVSISLDTILSAFRDELRRSEIDELQEIINSDAPPEERKRTFIEKIKSFGSDVASNILATILTNPQVYDQLGAIL